MEEWLMGEPVGYRDLNNEKAFGIVLGFRHNLDEIAGDELAEVEILVCHPEQGPMWCDVGECWKPVEDLED